MQVWDLVKLAKVAAGDEESLGRAGTVVKVEGKDADDPNQLVHVNLDETETHESGVVIVPQSDLTFLGRG